MKLRPVISALVKSLFKDIEQKLDDPDWDPLEEIKKKTSADAERKSKEAERSAKSAAYWEQQGVEAAQAAGPRRSPEEEAIVRIRHTFKTGAWIPQRATFRTQRYTNKETGIAFSVDETGYINMDGRPHIYSIEVAGVVVNFLSRPCIRDLEGIWKERKDKHEADEAAKRKAKAIAALTGGCS